MRTRILVVLAALLFFGSVSLAGNCGGRGRVVYHDVVKEVVIEPVVIATLTPVVAVAPAFGAFYQPPVAPQVAPAAAPAPSAQPDLAATLQQILKRLEALEAGKPAGPTLTPRAEPEDAPKPKGQALPVTSGNALAVLSTHCASCHTGPGSKGSVVIFDSPGVLSAKLPRGKVYRAAHKAQMPPGGKYLADEDVGKLLDWLGE